MAICILGDVELKNAVTNISHDLRTPLTAILGYLDLIEQEDRSEQVTQMDGTIEAKYENGRICITTYFPEGK